MKTMNKFFTFLVLVVLLVIPTSPAYAQGTRTDGGRVIFGSNFTLEKSDIFNGDLVVFGGNVTVEEDAKLNGNLIVFGGTLSRYATLCRGGDRSGRRREVDAPPI